MEWRGEWRKGCLGRRRGSSRGWAEKFDGLVGCYAEWLVGWVGRRVQMVGVWGGDRAEKLDEWVGNFAASTRSGSQGAPP